MSTDVFVMGRSFQKHLLALLIVKLICFLIFWGDEKQIYFYNNSYLFISMQYFHYNALLHAVVQFVLGVFQCEKKKGVGIES